VENEQESFSMSESDEDDDFAADEAEDEATAQRVFRQVPDQLVGQLADPFAAQVVGRQLSELLDDAEHIEEAEDPDLRADPIFAINLKAQLEDLLRGLARMHGQVFAHMLGTLLPHEQQHVRELILGQH